MRKSPKGWTPPPAIAAPVDPEEFKFCCALMSAGYSGQMPTENPTKQVVNIEEVGAVSLTDIPMNRAMLAVRDHFRETRSEERWSEFIPMSFRLMALADFVQLCMKKKDPRFEKFVEVQDEEVMGISDALLEAAATVSIGRRGFSRDELFAKATELANC